MTKAASMHVAHKYRNKNTPKKTLEQLKLTGSGDTPVSSQALMIDQDVLLTTNIYDTGTPEGQEDHNFHCIVAGFCSTNKKFTFQYCDHHNNEEELDWIHLLDDEDDGDIIMTDGVYFKTVREGVEWYKVTMLDMEYPV